MSYDFYVLLPGQEPLLLETASYNLSPVDDAIGGISWSMPTGDPKFLGVLDAIKQGEFPFEIWSGGVRQQFLCGWTEGLAQVLTDDAGKAVAQAFSGRFSGVVLDWAKIVPNAVADVTYLPSTAENAGTFLKGIIDFLIQNGYVDSGVIQLSFTSATTSDGLPWAKKSAMQFNFAGHIWEAMDQMQSAKLVSWRVRAGDNGVVIIDGFNEAQDGQDLSETVRLTRGANVKSSTRELRHDDTIGTGIWVKTANAAVDVILEDATARSRKPVSKLVVDQRDDIWDKKTALAYAQAKLPFVIKLNPQIEIRGVQLSTAHPDYVADTPVPGRDFWTGDFIALWEPDSIHLEPGQTEGDSVGTGQWRTYKIKQITLAVGAGGVAIAYDLVLGNVFRDPRVPAPPATTPVDPGGKDPANPQQPTDNNGDPVPTEEKEYLPSGGPGVLWTESNEKSAEWSMEPVVHRLKIGDNPAEPKSALTRQGLNLDPGVGGSLFIGSVGASGAGGVTVPGFQVILSESSPDLDQDGGAQDDGNGSLGFNSQGRLFLNGQEGPSAIGTGTVSLTNFNISETDNLDFGIGDTTEAHDFGVATTYRQGPSMMIVHSRLVGGDTAPVVPSRSLHELAIVKAADFLADWSGGQVSLRSALGDIQIVKDIVDGLTAALNGLQSQVDSTPTPTANGTDISVDRIHFYTDGLDRIEVNELRVYRTGSGIVLKPQDDSCEIQLIQGGTIVVKTLGAELTLGLDGASLTGPAGGKLVTGLQVNGKIYTAPDGDGNYEEVDTKGL